MNYGDEGTVVDYDGDFIAVEWDTENTLKHSCSGRCAKGHGWLLPYDCLELIAPATSNDLIYTVLPLDELFGLQDDSESGKMTSGVMY